MILSKHHGFIFIKTRKTAGSTLEKLLYPYLNKDIDICTGSERDGTPNLNSHTKMGHMPWQGVATYYGDEFNKHWKFTIERNPWDKVVSGYFWHQKIKPGMWKDKTFEEYLMINHNTFPMDWTHYAQEDELKVDKVFKYEEIFSMYEYLNDRFNLDITEEQIYNTRLKSGIRKNIDYREMYTNNKMIERVAHKFEREIKLLGYTYE
jgi:hypothetical protein